jgi:hypothetical protein
MIIVETPIFTKRIEEILTAGEYQELQLELLSAPEKGKVIPGTGGLRKLRWSAGGKGKRGGARVIYYYFHSGSELLMLFAFRKNEISDLTRKQLNMLRTVVEEAYHEK